LARVAGDASGVELLALETGGGVTQFTVSAGLDGGSRSGGLVAVAVLVGVEVWVAVGAVVLLGLAQPARTETMAAASVEISAMRFGLTTNVPFVFL